MAANEHKNLQDSNRHNPMGFEAADNDTVLAKSEGTGSGASDGDLEWISNSLVGVNNYKMKHIKTKYITKNFNLIYFKQKKNILLQNYIVNTFFLNLDNLL